MGGVLRFQLGRPTTPSASDGCDAARRVESAHQLQFRACPNSDKEKNALFEAGRKEGAFLRLRNFGFPDYLRRASIRTMLGP
jgi:hypothetical protein